MSSPEFDPRDVAVAQVARVREWADYVDEHHGWDVEMAWAADEIRNVLDNPERSMLP